MSLGRNPLTQHILGRRERRRIDVRERIKRAALDLFHEKGYEATTVEEIAERADVAKGTFFNHFHRKDALLLSIGEDVLDHIEESLGAVDTWQGTAAEQALRFSLALARLADRDRHLFKVMLIENMRHYWMREDADETQQEFRLVLRRMLERAQDRGEVAVDIDLAAAVRLLEAVHLLTTIEWIKRGGTEGELRGELIPQIAIIFRGLAQPMNGEHD